MRKKLSAEGYNSDALHGDLSQQQREYTMNRFRNRTLQLLIATDVAARGLDVNDLTHVINYNLPDDPDVYVHRSGRTGRAHRKGVSITIIHSREHGRLRDVERRVGKSIEKKRVPTGREICEKQLYHLVDKVENVEVEENQIKDYLPVIFNKLAWLDREELIKRFMSIEFNRFLAYYKDAHDINVEGKRPDQKRSDSRDDRRGDRRDRDDSRGRSRDDRPERRGERSRDDRPERRGERTREEGKRGEGKSERPSREFEKRDSGRERRRDVFDKPAPAKRGAERPKVKFTPLVINLGTVNKFNPKVLLSLVNQYMPDQEAQIGKIDVQFSHTIFDVDEAYQEDVIKAFKKAQFKGTKISVDPMRKKKGKEKGV